MSYKALYNKYRPSTFDEVCGQQAIVRTLKNSIATGKIGHAYLFTGPRGTGKTSMARLFAKALNCEEGLGHQCNQCSNCVALNNASHPDVIEIDAASNSGVENVRDLIEKVRYLPIKGKYKIYIIDEVHVMSKDAFNALLKTLEEPPEHVVFILATTEVHKVIPTILSRCQRYDFGKISEIEISNRIEQICQAEGIEYEMGAVKVLTELADGGMRDALSLLDQAVAFGGNVLKEADVLSVFGLASVKEKIDLIRKISEGNVTAVLSKLNQFCDSGVDIKRLATSLMEMLKDSLIYGRTKAASLLSSIKKEDAEELTSIVDSIKAAKMIDLLLKTTIDFKSVSNIKPLFELCLLEMSALFEPKAIQNIEIAPSKIEEEPHIAEIEKPVSIKEEQEEPIAATPISEKQEETVAEKPIENAEYNPDSGMKYNGTKIPDFLLEEPQKEEEPVVSVTNQSVPKETVEQLKIKDEGESLFIEDDTIIKIMVKGTKFKSSRQELRDRWESLERLKFDERFGQVASLLCEGKPFCLCDEVLLVNYNFTRFKVKANIKENQNAISELVESLIGRKVFVYGLDRNDSARTQKLYFDLNQVKRLPAIDSIVLDLPEGGN